jgi:phosphatidylserine/phosphatidylglycerophosphate/cardiolipin synthase-like enzyme
MADFLTTTGISHNIENIILEAKAKLILVSPYLQISKTLFERLKDADGRGVTIKIIYGKDQLQSSEKKLLASLNKIELYFFKNLHAKCYFNENKMVITSMNMYEFSERNNREMGVLIDRTIDKDLFDKAVNETLSILKSSEKVAIASEEIKKPLHVPKPVPVQKTNSLLNLFRSSKAFCIRCEANIPFNPEKPYCPTCFSVWSQYENYDYIENVCHRCGSDTNTSMVKPLCYDCYNR